MSSHADKPYGGEMPFEVHGLDGALIKIADQGMFTPSLDRPNRLEATARDLTQLFSDMDPDATVSFTAPYVEPAVLSLFDGRLNFDRSQGELTLDGHNVHLPGKIPTGIMEHFMRNPNMVLGRGALIAAGWGADHQEDVHIRTVDAHVRRLRNALAEGRVLHRQTAFREPESEPHPTSIIKTVPPQGYYLTTLFPLAQY